MRKFLILSITLLLTAGLWAQDSSSRDDVIDAAIDAVNNAASAAITEIQNASTDSVAKPIQDKAIADINETKDFAAWEIKTARDEFEITIVKDGAIIQIGRIKDKALADIQAIMGQETALKEVYGSQCTPKGLMHDGKFMYKGQVVIRKGGKTYSILGRAVNW